MHSVAIGGSEQGRTFAHDSPREFGLSLVLATLGRSTEIERFFGSIRECTSWPVEIIVVDQNDDDCLMGILESGRKLGLTIHHLRIAPRKGLSLARNEGLRIARYSIVGFPDDDCWYESGVIMRVIQEYRHDENIDGLVARWLDRHAPHDQPQRLSPSHQRRFSGVPIASICLFLSTEFVFAAGGFDEHLGVGTWAGSSEETDLVFRMMELGGRFVYCPDILVRHHWAGTAVPITGKLSSILRGAILRARGTGAIYAKHALDNAVVLKGLVAPIVKMFGLSGGVRGLAYWLGTALGRWQGFARWRRLRTLTSSTVATGNSR
jgi:glycosyltransferase involved in cell wall biosynthesis